ncbi:MAG TPA: proline--tRNA ligase, partial [Actinomycetales bacterium]|nr:proline--tRNA ligase [Actinomycetales bacterium]
THEEMFTLLVKDLYSSYKDLPLTLYQIQTKYRDEARPRAGLLRGREFVMKDAYSFDIDEEGLTRSYEAQREAYIKFFDRLGLPYVIVSAVSGAMGGSRSEEFLHPTPVGEDEFVRSDGGYLANVEAMTTVAGPEIPWDEDTPLWDTVPTPGAGTIAELVELANGAFPRPDRAWDAADTLKNVVLTAIHPDGRREVFVVGLPGDREVDLARVTAQLEPAEVEPATPADLERHPELVPGYIGPGVLGPNREAENAVRYLLDPRVVAGTSWITGANKPDAHVVGIVMGRDFTCDGYIECAQVRDGDPAPDGSGPVEIARGIEIGHIFQLGTKYAEVLDLSVLDENGKARTVTMGSYGIGVSRVLAALAEANNDDKGLRWPAHLAPAQVHLVATGKDEAVFERAEELAKQWTAAGLEVLFDDRKRVSPGVKFADAELLGMPVIVIVGRGLANGVVEVRDRSSDERTEVPVEAVVEDVVERFAD